MTKRCSIPTAILGMLLLIGCDSQIADPANSSMQGPESAVRLPNTPVGGAGLYATMTGDEEAPGPGDPDGAGTARFSLNPGKGLVCYELEVTDILPATAAHIHIAPAGEPGPVVVPLTAPAGGSSSGCVMVDRSLVISLIQNPADYYVNVHNSEYPAGAVRGQLER